MDRVVEIASNISIIRERIEAACQRAGRSPDEVMLVAISKKKPVEMILQAMQAGITHFGENRLEEAQTKIPEVAALCDTPPRWHMVGHVQSRKAKDVVGMGFELVHSLDSLKLAQRYDRFAAEAGIILPVLLEVNVSGEDTKSGWMAHNWENQGDVQARLWQDIEALLALPNIRVGGLMTMAPYEAAPEDTRPVFRALARLRDALRDAFGESTWGHVSMGMTNDFEVAIEEGATIIRIGRAIFGERS